MKVYELRTASKKRGDALAYLFYYERSGHFAMEIPEESDEWDLPMYIASFFRKGELTLGHEVCKKWLAERVLPSERQDIREILTGLKKEEYHVYDLLTACEGRCIQDDYYLKEVKEKDLPLEIRNRQEMRLEDITPLSTQRRLAFFHNGDVKICSLESVVGEKEEFRSLWSDRMLYRSADVQPGGYGIRFGDSLSIGAGELYNQGELLPLSGRDFKDFAGGNLVSTSEAAGILGCSRQYVDELVRKERLHPVKTLAKDRLFLRQEVFGRVKQ